MGLGFVSEEVPVSEGCWSEVKDYKVRGSEALGSDNLIGRIEIRKFKCQGVGQRFGIRRFVSQRIWVSDPVFFFWLLQF